MSDYSTLIAEGYAIYWGPDPDGWRREMRRQARADKLRIRTGLAEEGDSRSAWAWLLDRGIMDTDEARERLQRAFDAEGLE